MWRSTSPDNWQQIANSLRPVLRRTLNQRRQPLQKRDKWLPAILLSAVELWPELPVEEQDALQDALARIAGLVIAHQDHPTPGNHATWLPAQDTVEHRVDWS